MNESNNKLESLIKLAPFAVLAVFLLIFIVMSQIPPSGQWVKDSVAPVLPTLKYSHINESWGQNYKREDVQPSTVTTNEVLGPPPGLPRDDKDAARSYFASPRMLSARNSIHDQSNRDQSINTNINPAITQAVPPENNSPAEDLLRPGYLNDNQVVYDPAFGNARGSVRTQ